MKGKFIALEGPDASGKTTQQANLIARIEENGLIVHREDFPQYDQTFGQKVWNMLHNQYGDYKNIDPDLAIAMYAIDRFSAKSRIEANLNSGMLVVTNRYTLSSMAHQTARVPDERKREILDYIFELENKLFSLPVPDLYIHLDVPVEITRRLLLERIHKEKDAGKSSVADALESDFDHQVEAAKMYRELGRTLSGITSIDCTDSNGELLSSDEIHERVWEISKEFLSAELQEGRINRERE